MNPTTDDPTLANGSSHSVSAPDEDTSNPVLWKLKQEAEAEVKRLRAELEVRNLPSNKKIELKAQLNHAEQRVETELQAIRQFELVAHSTSKGVPVSKAKREQTELLEAAWRILPEYSAKLERLVPSYIALANEAVEENVLEDILCKRLQEEFKAIASPLRAWITKLSALLEEGRLTEIQRLELRLRLTELESKFQTANRLMK